MPLLLVGDAPYYQRFGFSTLPVAGLSLPGPYERDRFLGLELISGALEGARGMVVATGRVRGKFKPEARRLHALRNQPLLSGTPCGKPEVVSRMATGDFLLAVRHH